MLVYEAMVTMASIARACKGRRSSPGFVLALSPNLGLKGRGPTAESVDLFGGFLKKTLKRNGFYVSDPL